MANLALLLDANWHPINVDADCRNWVDGKASVQTRMSNHVWALRKIAKSINHCMGQCPRIIFSKCLPLGDLTPATSANPLYKWEWYDEVSNARHRIFRFLTVPPLKDNNTSNYYASRLDNSLAVDANTETPYRTSGIPEEESQEIKDLIVDEVPHERGARANAFQAEGVRVVERYQFLELVVQEMPRWYLDTQDDVMVAAGGPFPGDPVLANYAEELRSKFHTFRKENLGQLAANWHAYTVGGTYATTAITANTGGKTGIRIQSTTLYNILCPSDTRTVDATALRELGSTAATKSEKVPGWACHCYLFGHGDETADDNAYREVDITVRINYAHTNSAPTSPPTIRIIGPTGHPTNSEDLTPAAGTSGYVQSTTVKLDSSQTNVFTAAADNKIDIFAKVANASTDNLYIYGVQAFMRPEFA